MKLTRYFLLFAAGSISLFAQENSKFTFDAGAGFTASVGTTGANLATTGWNMEGGAGYKINHNFSLNLDLGYNYLSVNTATLNSIGVPGGYVDIFTSLVNPTYKVGLNRHVNLYLTGGGGLFHQSQNFSAPVFGTTGLTNSFFGFAPVNGVGTQLVSNYSVNKPGYDVGGGVEFTTIWRAKVFMEARYEHMFNTGTHTDIIPVTFGWRW
jgi:hypothetical protein